MAIRIEFGSRDAAQKIRNNPKYRGFLAEEDDARRSTAVLKGGTPDQVANEITAEAADSKSHEADKAGQVPLTKDERKRIDFSRKGMNVPKARSIKGIAQNEGVDDWTAYADFDVTVDENRSLLKRAKREEGGQRGGRESMSGAEVDKRLASAHHERQRTELGRAKDFALVKTDTEAQGFLSEQGSVSEVYDIEYSRDGGQLRGQGEDFDRLEERHNNRSSRARTMDEKQDAKVTRDPVEWANNPDRYDYPGIDTVQPQRLHDRRSKRAKQKDERELAPIADSKQQWAMNPDRYDWPGVDTPSETMRSSTTTSSGGLSSVPAALSPQDFEGEFDEPMGMSATNTPFGLAGGAEADMAFVSAEEDRASDDFASIDGEFSSNFDMEW